MHHCQLEEGQLGLCRARRNTGHQAASVCAADTASGSDSASHAGTVCTGGSAIRCENYGQITSLALDPIEKKPLKMFCPGSLILSVGSYGCNLRCPFCQNHEISMAEKDSCRVLYLSPGMLVREAVKYQKSGNIGVAFTYNEPLVGWEYVRDTAKLVKQAGMKNVLVTNGSASLSVLEELLPFIDAMNIDLKGFRREYYQKLGGDLETVKEFIVRAAADAHVELTTLIVPGENDDPAEMEEEAAWIASVQTRSPIGQLPLHVTRFFPQYHMTDKSPTDVAAVYDLARIAGKYLKHVFVGNC